MAADDDVVSITHLEAMCDAPASSATRHRAGHRARATAGETCLTADLIFGFLADDQVTKLMPTRD